MSWRPARALVVLQNELDDKWPKRTTPDWIIGDVRHQDRPSDHNPNSDDVVCAMDIREGNIGLDSVANHLHGLIGSHPALKYVIYNKKIAGLHTDGKWQAYGGSNPHETHIHVSVGRGPDGQSYGPYDSLEGWDIDDIGRKKTDKDPEFGEWYRGKRGSRTVHGGARKFKVWHVGDDVKYIQRYVGTNVCGPADGYFGRKTRAGVMWYQRMRGLTVDGIVGPRTWESLKVRYTGD